MPAIRSQGPTDVLMTTQSMVQWLGQSQTYAGPSAARYGTPSLLDVGGTFYTLTSSASTDPTLKDITFNNQTINFFGVQALGPTSVSQAINATSPQAGIVCLGYAK
jgi:hypothetical protein